MKKLLPALCTLLLMVLFFSCERDYDFKPLDHLVAYYTFNGNANDATKYHNDGMPYKVTSTTDMRGRANRAYYFNGRNSFIMIPGDTSLNITGSFTISAWLCPDRVSTSKGGDMCVVWRGDPEYAHDPYNLYFTQNGIAIRKDVGEGYTINQAVFSMDASYQNKWFNATGTYNAATNTARMYIDGVLVKEEHFATSTILYTTYAFWNIIGAVDYGEAQFYQGKMDEVRIYNTALSADAVKTLAALYY